MTARTLSAPPGRALSRFNLTTTRNGSGIGVIGSGAGGAGVGETSGSGVAVGEAGETYNINADLVAGALGAAKLILLTDVPGVLDRDHRLISSLTRRQAVTLMEEGIVVGGMLPKIKCCLEALDEGVAKAHILDGRALHAVLLEIFTDTGIGTEIVG